MAEPRNCPQCGTPMAFRLGEYNCSQCGHTEAQAAPAPKSTTSGPGFRQPWQSAANLASKPSDSSPHHWQPSRTGSPGVPPPPPPGTLYQPGQQIPGVAVMDQPLVNNFPTLQTEKHIYMALSLIGAIFSLVPGVNADLEGIPGAGRFFILLLGVLITAFVLYGTAIWAKWCCAGCTAIQLAIIVIGGLVLLATSSEIAQLGALAGVGIAVVVIYLTFVLAINGWLVWILWRDIQQLNG